MSSESMIEILRVAFPPHPIAAASAFDERGQLYTDVRAYTAALDGKTWEQFDPSYAARRSDALSFLGGDTLRAVLPRYLDLLLTLPPTSPVVETLLPILTRPDPADRSAVPLAWKQERFAWLDQGLSTAQKRAVAVVLQRFCELHPYEAERTQRALDRYWRMFV